MTCQMIGRPPISIIGFGRRCDSSAMRVPRPPARMTAFMLRLRSAPLEEAFGPVGDAFADLALIERKAGFLLHEVAIACQEGIDGGDRIVPCPIGRGARRADELRHDAVA